MRECVERRRGGVYPRLWRSPCAQCAETICACRLDTVTRRLPSAAQSPRMIISARLPWRASRRALGRWEAVLYTLLTRLCVLSADPPLTGPVPQKPRAPACRCTTCSGSLADQHALPHLGACNLCGSKLVTHGVLCLASGLWRAEYCRACTRQQKEDGIVCSKWREDLYVEVLRESRGVDVHFLSLRGRCGLCYRKAVFGAAFDSACQSPQALLAANSSVLAGCVQEGFPSWCSKHRGTRDVAVLPALCTSTDGKGGVCGRAAHMISAALLSAWECTGGRQVGGAVDDAGMVSSTQAAGRTDAGKDEGVGMPRPETCVKHSRRTHRGIGHTKSASVSVDQFWRSHLRARHLGLRAKHSLSPLQPDLGARPSASGNETNTTGMQGWARRGRRGLDKV